MRRRLRTAPTPRGTYTEWWWPPPPTIARTIPRGYGSFEHVLLPEVDPAAAYVWAHDFGFVGGQTGRLALEAAPKAAVFSISAAVAAEGSAIERTIDGWSCRIGYAWAAGRRYRLRLHTVEHGWWAASVSDEASSAETEIGLIQVPPAWRQLGTPSVMCTEYVGRPVGACADLPRCQAVFSSPCAEGGAVSPERMHNRLGAGSCDSSDVEPVPGGVRHSIGSR